MLTLKARTYLRIRDLKHCPSSSIVALPANDVRNEVEFFFTRTVAQGTQPRSQRIATQRLASQTQLEKVRTEEEQESENEEEVGDQDQFETVDKLTGLGINAGDVKKLQDAGIYTCNGLMMCTRKTLGNIKGLSDNKVEKILEAAGHFVSLGYITGKDMLQKRKAVVQITTGSRALDELLGGGVETMSITEAFGEFRTGKTQIAHTLAVSTQLPLKMHGGNGKVAYIDTEGTFRPDRIVSIAERFGLDPDAVLDNIVYARAYTHEHQYNLLLGLAAKMTEEPFRILIVDSVMALFRVDFSGRGELADRQQKLAQMLSRMTKIAEEFNIAVFMTNQVIADPGGGTFVVDPKKPAGGHVLAHASTVRLMLRKGKGDQRICKVYDAPNLPETEATPFRSHLGALQTVRIDEVTLNGVGWHLALAGLSLILRNTAGKKVLKGTLGQNPHRTRQQFLKELMVH